MSLKIIVCPTFRECEFHVKILMSKAFSSSVHKCHTPLPSRCNYTGDTGDEISSKEHELAAAAAAVLDDAWGVLSLVDVVERHRDH